MKLNHLITCVYLSDHHILLEVLHILLEKMTYTTLTWMCVLYTYVHMHRCIYGDFDV